MPCCLRIDCVRNLALATVEDLKAESVGLACASGSRLFTRRAEGSLRRSLN